jgi:GNAT superfamily N-acetyltransferase
MIISELNQEQINKSIELISKIMTDEGELFPCYVNGEDKKHNDIKNGIVRFFDDSENAGVFASVYFYGFKIFIAFEKDTDKYSQELAEFIRLAKEKNPSISPNVFFIAEQKNLINGMMQTFQFAPPLPNGFYYTSHEFVMDKEHFKGFANDKHLEIRPFEAGMIDAYSLLLDNAMTFASPPPNFQGYKQNLAEDLKKKVFYAFYKANELVGLYWLDNDFRTIDIMAVAPIHQRQGYGGIILSHAINNVLTEQKHMNAILYCVDWNDKGLAFYKKYGMIPKGHAYSMNLK